MAHQESFTYITGRVMPHSYTREGRQCMNRMSWKISENEAQQSGIYPVFRGAVIVQLPDGDEFDGLFYAHFKLRSTQACEGRQLYKSFVQEFGGDNDGPVRFDTGVNLQADELSDHLEHIRLDEVMFRGGPAFKWLGFTL
jgi:hypothetical protein